MSYLSHGDILDPCGLREGVAHRTAGCLLHQDSSLLLIERAEEPHFPKDLGDAELPDVVHIEWSISIRGGSRSIREIDLEGEDHFHVIEGNPQDVRRVPQRDDSSETQTCEQERKGIRPETIAPESGRLISDEGVSVTDNNLTLLVVDAADDNPIPELLDLAEPFSQFSLLSQPDRFIRKQTPADTPASNARLPA